MTDERRILGARVVSEPRLEPGTAVVVASECDLYGHDDQLRILTEPGSHDPRTIHCLRCGKSWKVER